jgi:hypothetical protein
LHFLKKFFYHCNRNYLFMKKLYLLFIIIFTCAISFSQTIFLSGRCITETIPVTYIQDIDGKPAYQGSGTVAGLSGTPVIVYWIPAPDNLWVIAFDGQPYFSNACNSNIPPGSTLPSCPWLPVSGNDCPGASPLSVTGAVVLPVAFTSFTASAAGTTVELQWTTAQESNNRGFTIQRSADGVQWTDIGFVAGVGNTSTISSYRFTDKLPGTGINFYRLRQQDFDGQTSYSGIVKATINSSKFFTLSDNPGPGLFKLNMAASGEPVELSVSDARGRVVLYKKATAGNQLIDLSKEAQGVYWLLLKKGTIQTGVKLIKL